MNQTQIVVLDYGLGNLFSVSKALEHCGAVVKISDSPNALQKADGVVLPGVGAFASGMTALYERKLIRSIQEYVNQNRPFLGICLGMQMMLEKGEEFESHEGLGLVPGKVISLPEVGIDKKTHKIPFIGWNTLKPYADTSSSCEDLILKSLPPGSSVYYVHSYMAQLTDPQHCVATSFHNGQPVTAVIKTKQAYGLQFHAERSGKVGLQILKNFLAFVEKAKQH